MARRPPSQPRVLRLALVLLLPAFAFGGLWRWSAAIAAEPEPIDAAPVDPNEGVDSAAPPAAPELATSLLSLRRTPDAIVGDIVAERRAAIVAPLVRSLDDLVGDDACVAIVDDGGTSVFDHRIDASLVPASNEKLFVAAAALDRLGPNATLTTDVRGVAPVDGTVNGPLYLVGGGDPLLSTDDFARDNGLAIYEVATIDGLVMQLVASGITRVAGDLVAVDGRYDDERRAPQWTAAITGYDVPPLGSLIVNDGLDGAGSVPLEPAVTAAELFRRQLRAAGIEVTGSIRSTTDPNAAGSADVLASASSPSVATIVTEMLQLSDNLTAELLLKEVGLAAAGVGSRAAGIGAINDLLTQWSVPLGGVALTDGSGLSRENRVTCAAMVDLLEAQPMTEEVVDDLPVAGVSGTLADALIGSPAEGTMRAKTGTLNGVKALSGVQPDATGAAVYFSVILNGPDRQLPANYEPVWRAVADLISRHNTPIEIDRAAFAPLPVANTTTQLQPADDSPITASANTLQGQVR